jgi:magnesium-transporting ATPase (P-type)
MLAHPSDQDWHAQASEEVLQALESAATGLSDQEAQARLAAHGPNRLPQASGPSAAGLLLAQVRSPLMYASCCRRRPRRRSASSRTRRWCRRSSS